MAVSPTPRKQGAIDWAMLTRQPAFWSTLLATCSNRKLEHAPGFWARGSLYAAIKNVVNGRVLMCHSIHVSTGQCRLQSRFQGRHH